MRGALCHAASARWLEAAAKNRISGVAIPGGYPVYGLFVDRRLSDGPSRHCGGGTV